jgi:hypothetical protein
VRRIALSGVGVAVVCFGLVLVGRSEAGRETRHENDQMRKTLAMVSPNLGERLSYYRPTPWFGCFIYGFGSLDPFGVEICVDDQGRVIETIDRRRGAEHIASLRYEPSAARVHLDVRRLLGLLHRRDPKRYPSSLRTLPLASTDLGPQELPRLPSG